ncbi:MAG: alpha/beta fold hydrolase, partial [Planctomycetia bacterium]|nr:alpha/beta fold hydrolase [Planctomycetia bacterium]
MLQYLDADRRMQPIRTAEDWPKRRAHVLANMQRVMGPLPALSRRVPPEVVVQEEVALDKVVRKKLTFLVEKDDRLSAYLLLPKERKGPAPAMLALHQTTRVGKGEPAGLAGNPNLHYGLELAERGYVVLAPDYPGYGDYALDVYAKGYDSGTMKGIWNHMRCVDLLQSLPEVDGDRIGVIGHSLGGHNSLFVAAFDERLQVVVTSCGFNSFFKYKDGNLAGWSHQGYMPRIAAEFGRDPKQMPFDFTELLGVLAPRAVFINAPLKDSNFEVSGVQDCVTAAMPVYGLFHAREQLFASYPDAGHEFPPAVRQTAYGYIDRALRPRPTFTRLVAHWDQYGDPDYLKFIEEARPEVAQVGFYGAHFWSLAHTPQYKGYPAHFPVQGLAECGQWFEKLNRELHKRKAKAVGHFNVGFLVGDPDGPQGPRGFFKFYRDLWDEKELGKKPTANPLDLLEMNAGGTPRTTNTYSIGGMKEYHACLNNPHWRAVLKAWAKRGIERGVDGYIINYFYRHDCLCEHCQAGFKRHLTERYSP